jgi:hypothetical protein
VEAWRPPPFKYVKSHLLQEKSLSSVRERKENKERKKETARCLNLIMLALLLCFCFVFVALQKCQRKNMVPGGLRFARGRKKCSSGHPFLPLQTTTLILITLHTLVHRDSDVEKALPGRLTTSRRAATAFSLPPPTIIIISSSRSDCLPSWPLPRLPPATAAPPTTLRSTSSLSWTGARATRTCST